ncbi:hypothetical protein AAC387_Pa02g4926 [Persea americana]
MLFFLAISRISIHNLSLKLEAPTHRVACTHSLFRPNSPLLQKQQIASLLQSSSHPNQLKQIHAFLLTTGLSIKNSLMTHLLSSMMLLGDMTYARQLFDEMHNPRVYVWNILIRGYLKNDLCTEALCVYHQMRRLGIRPDKFTFPFVLKACSQLVAVWMGLVAHAHVVKFGLSFDTIVRTELMVMYAKFGDLGSADYAFQSMRKRDLISWNALIAVYAQGGHADEALKLFDQMEAAGVAPDSVTLASVLSACAYLGSLEFGIRLHRQIVEQGLEMNVFVENALLDMYAKCGSMEMASQVFINMCKRNVVSWSTMIGAYAINGENEKAFALFSQMKDEGVRPNHVTLLSVLTACSHAGLISQGWSYFKYMAQPNSDIIPRIEHYACMVDLLGRSGYLQEAYDFIKRMPIEPDPGVWGAMLGACTIHHNIELGQIVADHLFSLAPDAASYHVLLSNIYAAAGRWGDVEKVRQRMKDKGIKKVAAYSSVQANGKVHLFHGGDRLHPQSASIYQMLEELMKQLRSVGYAPKTNLVLHDVDMEEKEVMLGTHSEKLAIAFGLISLSSESPIRVMKNLRICSDCHTFSKYVSQITQREIIVRDKNRFHHFKAGFCSCKDFW